MISENRSSFEDYNHLISSLKTGNQNAYKYLVNSYYQKLCTYAYSLINDRDSAEDIVQNVFIKIWKKRKHLNSDFNIKSYLYKSVYNEFIDDYRKNKKVLKLEKKYIDELTYILEEDNDGHIDRVIKIVKQEIEHLPPKCKKIFLLSKQEGLTNIEIAEYLNISIKSVEAQITKAFKILRDKLGNQFEGILFLLFSKKVRLS